MLVLIRLPVLPVLYGFFGKAGTGTHPLATNSGYDTDGVVDTVLKNFGRGLAVKARPRFLDGQRKGNDTPGFGQHQVVDKVLRVVAQVFGFGSGGVLVRIAHDDAAVRRLFKQDVDSPFFNSARWSGMLAAICL